MQVALVHYCPATTATSAATAKSTRTARIAAFFRF
jgi:hypothetical protein